MVQLVIVAKKIRSLDSAVRKPQFEATAMVMKLAYLAVEQTQCFRTAIIVKGLLRIAWPL